MNKIILLENIDEAKLILKSYGKNSLCSKDILVIAMHPKVRSYLKKTGIHSKDTLDYLDNDAQHRIILKTEEITEELLRHFHIRDSFGIEKGYQETFIHNVRLYINHFLTIIEILDGIKKKHAISEIICFLPKNRSRMYAKEGYIQDEERFWGFLAKDFSLVNKIDFTGVPLGIKKTNIALYLVSKFVRKIGELIALIDYVFLTKKRFGDKKIIVVPALSYKMKSIFTSIKQRHPDTKCIMIWEGKSTLRDELRKIYLTSSNFLKKLRKKSDLDCIIHLDLIRKVFRKDIIQQKKIEEEFNKLKNAIRLNSKDFLVHHNISFSSYLEEKINTGLRFNILSLQHTTVVLSKILQRIQPKLIISMYSQGINYMLGELSHILGLSSLNISHGTHVPPNNEFEKIENYQLARSVILNTYKTVAVQTPWANKFLDYYKDTRPRLYTGPLLYSIKNNGAYQSKRNKIFGEETRGKVIVHATTQKARHGMRFHINETLDEYIASLADIVNAVNSLEDIYFVLRPHPICDISEDEFRTLLPSCSRLIIMNKGSFEDILSIADILISYSSTCIEEALQSQIPVILYDKWQRYNHFNIEETRCTNTIKKKPVYYFTNSRIFAESLQKILDTLNDSPLTDNDLIEYKYPKEYKVNFFNFIDRSLKGETII